MKYCKTCKLNYRDNQKKCLFCNNELTTIENSIIDNKHNFPKHKKNSPLSFILRFIYFILIIASVTCIYLDYINTDKHHLDWSLVVLVSSIYLILMANIITKEGSWISKIILSTFVTILEVVFVGLSINNYNWAVDYVFPFALISNLVFLTIVLLILKKSWFDFSYYLIGVCILGIIPSILNLCNVTKVEWPSTVCLFVSVSVFTGLFFLKGKSSIKELKRRFHI